MPSRITEVPVMPLSQLVRPEVMAASGRPSSMNISRPTTSDAHSGMMTTGISPRSHRGTLIWLIHSAVKPAIRPPTMPPMNPPPTKTATAPAVNPGAMPGRSAMANEM